MEGRCAAVVGIACKLLLHAYACCGSHDAGEHKATPEMKASGDKSKPERFLPLNAAVYSFCPWLLRRGRRRSGGRPQKPPARMERDNSRE